MYTENVILKLESYISNRGCTNYKAINAINTSLEQSAELESCNTWLHFKQHHSILKQDDSFLTCTLQYEIRHLCYCFKKLNSVLKLSSFSNATTNNRFNVLYTDDFHIEVIPKSYYHNYSKWFLKIKETANFANLKTVN